MSDSAIMPLPEGTRLRLARDADADVIFSFDHVAQVTPSRRAFVQRSIANGCCHVVETPGGVAAYGIVENTFFGHGFIPLLYVASPWRRRGIGSELVAHLEQACPTSKLFSSTNESNLPMRQLLDKLGFVSSGRIENLDDGDPELVYFKRVR